MRRDSAGLRTHRPDGDPQHRRTGRAGESRVTWWRRPAGSTTHLSLPVRRVCPATAAEGRGSAHRLHQRVITLPDRRFTILTGAYIAHQKPTWPHIPGRDPTGLNNSPPTQAGCEGRVHIRRLGDTTRIALSIPWRHFTLSTLGKPP